MTMLQCQAVSNITDPNGNKIGEEIRFYAAGAQVPSATIHITDPNGFGRYVSGQSYDVQTGLTDSVVIVAGSQDYDTSRSADVLGGM